MEKKKIEFENHFSLRVMEIIFPSGFQITKPQDLEELKAAWKDNLKFWHSPYTCLFDLRNFVLSETMGSDFERTIRFFQNFFMRKMVGFYDLNSVKINVSFEVFENYEQASSAAGLNKEGGKLARNLDDLRSRISIDNDFNAHVMEINFLADTHFETKEDVEILKSKLKNILRLWHSPYSILINCVNCTFSEQAKESFGSLDRFLKGFFCKKILGYAPKAEKQTYPFEMFRSRHLAAAQLQHQGLQSGAVANCSQPKFL